MSEADSVRVAVSRGQRYIYWWLGLCIVLLVALAAVGLAWASSQRSSSTAECVNDVLATRNGPATKEVDAQIKKAESDLKALNRISSAPRAGLSDYTESTRQYIVALRAVKAERDRNPLGRC